MKFRYKSLAGGLILGVIAFILQAQSVSAAPFLPDQADFGGANVQLLVGNPNATQGIYAPISRVKIYSTNPTITVAVNGAHQCPGDGYDYLNPGTTRFEIYATDAAENRVGTPRAAANNGFACGNISMTATHPGPRSSLIGHTQYYVFTFEARLLGTAFGWNAFNLSSPGTFIGYSDNSGENFALKGSFNLTAPTYANYTLRFGVPCEITTNVSRTLRWFDADQGQSNQARIISFDVYDDTAGAYISQGNVNLGGQNQGGFQTLTFRPGHRYRWIWRNVSSWNGIQMQVPFDSIYYNTNCTTPPQVSCLPTAVDPTSPEAGQPFTVSGGFTTAGGTGPNVNASVTAVIPLLGFNQVIFSGSVPRSGANIIRSTGPITAPTGIYSGYFQVNVSGGTPASQRCNFSVRVVNKPYYRVYGGDVFAGAGFMNGTVCTTDQNAAIITWNRNSSPYLGAGSQLGVFALGVIVDFASGNLRNNNLPKPITFANVDPSYANVGTGTFGGGLMANAGAATCAPDYWADATNIRSSGYVIGGTAKTYNLGQREVIYVDGDVFINTNIRYASGNYQNVNMIPNFRLVARGNIYVAPNVSELNGVYIAMPRAGTNDTGRFYTCWPGHIPTTADLNGICRSNRLTVYGAVVAELIKFTRTSGTLSGSTTTERYNNNLGTAAERFIYSPEVWLINGFGGDGATVDSIIPQPPVL